MEEERDTTRADRDASPPPPPPTIGVDRIEFRRAVNDLGRQVQEEAASTRQMIGWLLATMGLLAVLMGAYCMCSRDGGWS